MNESETGAELIDPALRAAGWGVTDDSKILREYGISAGKIQVGGRGKREVADYVLEYITTYSSNGKEIYMKKVA